MGKKTVEFNDEKGVLNIISDITYNLLEERTPCDYGEYTKRCETHCKNNANCWYEFFKRKLQEKGVVLKGVNNE